MSIPPLFSTRIIQKQLLLPLPHDIIDYTQKCNQHSARALNTGRDFHAEGTSSQGNLTGKENAVCGNRIISEKRVRKDYDSIYCEGGRLSTRHSSRHLRARKRCYCDWWRRCSEAQFLADQRSDAGQGRPGFLYSVETALQIHITELSEPLRELYVAAYTLPTTAEYIITSNCKETTAAFCGLIYRMPRQRTFMSWSWPLPGSPAVLWRGPAIFTLR